MGFKIILATASPRRKDLFSKTGMKFKTIASNTEEDLDEKDPIVVVRECAARKAEKIRKKINNGLIIAADTVVVLRGKIIGKPVDSKDAFKTLKLLSGRSHYVITGIVLMDASTGESKFGFEKTKVFFRELSDDEIKKYVDSKEPLDKAGSYGIQETGAIFVRRIEGCYTNVVGLPLVKLIEMLKEFGVMI